MVQNLLIRKKEETSLLQEKESLNIKDMKKNKPYYPLIILLSLLLSLTMIQCSSSKSTTNLERGDIEEMIKDHSFVFVAERMNPLRGRSRILTSSYDVRVNNDSLVSFLPYFGRAYSAPIDPTNVGTQFTSTNFTYQVNADKKNQWRVTLTPKDAPTIQELSFTIFDNGTTSLSINSTSKDQISYAGYLKKIE